VRSGRKSQRGTFKRDEIAVVKKKDIPAYARKDWELVAGMKADHWARVKELRGLAEGIRVAEELRMQVLLSHPGWPSDGDRREDQEAHIRLSAQLRSVVLAGPH
jgi:hypothetical protein